MLDVQQLKKDWNDNHILDFILYNLQVTPVAVFVSGSQLNGTATEKSDIDLVIFVSEERSIKELPYRIKYNNVLIHGWIRPIVYNLRDITAKFSYGFIFDGLFKEEYCLWVNPDYSNLFNFIAKYKKDLSKIGLYLSLEKEKDAITIISNTKQYLGSKAWYALIYGYCYINELSIPTELLKHIKERILSKEEKEEVVQYIYNMWNQYINDNDFSIVLVRLIEAQRQYIKDKTII